MDLLDLFYEEMIGHDWKRMESLWDLLVEKHFNYLKQYDDYIDRIRPAFSELIKRYDRELAPKRDPGSADSEKSDDTDPTSGGNDLDHKGSLDSVASIMQSHPEVDSLCEKIKENMKHVRKDESSSRVEGPQNAVGDWKAMATLEDLLVMNRVNYETLFEDYTDRIRSAFFELKKRSDRVLPYKMDDPGNAGSVKVDDTDPASRGNDSDHKESSDSNANIIQSLTEAESQCEKIKEIMKDVSKDESSSHGDGPQNATEDWKFIPLQAMQYLLSLQKRLWRIWSGDKASDRLRILQETTNEADNLMWKFANHLDRQDLSPAELARLVMEVRQKQINMSIRLHELRLGQLDEESQLVQVQQEDWFYMGDLTQAFQSVAETCTSEVKSAAEQPTAEQPPAEQTHG